MVKKTQVQIAKAKKTRFSAVRDIFDELRKVVWPSRKETFRLTLIVIGICIAVGIFLGAIDYGFSELMTRVFLGGS